MDSGKNAAQGAALLLVIGEPFSEENKNLILAEITKGFRCWDAEETGIDINEELAQIANRADLGEEGPCVSPYGHQLKEGERIIRHQSQKLAVEILVNPQKTSVTLGVKNFLASPFRYKHITYAGHAFQGSGAWILQDDTYTFSNFAHAFEDEAVADTLKLQQDASLVIYTATGGDWTNGHIAKSEFSKMINVRLNPSDKLEIIHGVLQFSAYVSNFIRIRELNELLKSSDVVGNIKFSRPTMYIFPACQGDSALFGINGFNLLVNGGYSRKACFWDFTRHLDRIDAALMTHLGTDNLFGLSTVFQRKSMENIHPEIGFMYVNATDKIKSPAEGDDDKKESLQVNLAEEGHRLIQYARQIGPAPQPVSRPHSGHSIEPINLYHKVGIGSLDMYVLNPVTDSKELKDFYQQWNQNVAQFGSNWHMPLPNTLSVCALLVWKPSDPNDNITRVFFPGNAPQHKVLEGLEKLKSLDFLKHTQCSKTTLSAKTVGKKPSALAPKAAKPKVSPVTTPRNETPKKEMKESPVQKSSTPKARAAPSAVKAKKEKEDAKKEKEDVNKKAMKTPEKPKAEKLDKGKKTPKTPSKSVAVTSPKKSSPVKEPEHKPESETVVPNLIDTTSPSEEPTLSGSEKEEASLVPAPEEVSSQLLEPTPAPEIQENLIDIAPSSVPEPKAEPGDEPQGGGALDKKRLRELGIYDDDQDIEEDLGAQQSGESPEDDSQSHQQQMFGGMADSMHQDLMDDYSEQNAMQGSYHADLMTGSMHEALFDDKNKPFNGHGYLQNGDQAIDELVTPEDEKSEEIQPQALPDPVPYVPESYGPEPDVIPAMIGKEEPQVEDKSEDTPAQEPDLLIGNQETEKEAGAFDDESTLPVDEKQSPATPDEVETNLPEDIQEKDSSEMTEKETVKVEEEAVPEPIEEVQQDQEPCRGVNEDVYKIEEAIEATEGKKDEAVPSEQLKEDLEEGAPQSREGIQQEKDEPCSEVMEDVYKTEEAVETIEGEKDEEMHPEQLEDFEEAVSQSEEDILATEEKELEESDELQQKPSSPEIPDELERPVSPEPDILEQDKLMPEESGDLMQETKEKPEGITQQTVPVSDIAEEIETKAKVTELESKFQERQNNFDERPIMGRAGIEDVEENAVEEPQEQRSEEREDSEEMQDSEEERAESPDSQVGFQDNIRDSLEKDVQEQLKEDADDYDTRDSIERETEDLRGMQDEEGDERDSMEKYLSESQTTDEAPETFPVEKDISEDVLAENRYEKHYMEEENLPEPPAEDKEAKHTDDFEQRDSIERSFSPETSEQVEEEENLPEPPAEDREANYTDDFEQGDSIERSFSPETAEQMEEEENEEGNSSEDRDERESAERDARGSEERSVSPDHRQSADRSYEEESEEEEEEAQSSSFDQEEATDEKCLIQDSTSEGQRRFDDEMKPMETDSLAAPADTLADQPSDNLLTPESEYTDASHGGQMGYHEIDEQDADSVEGVDDREPFTTQHGHQMHPFGEGFEQFTSTGYSTGLMDMQEPQQTNLPTGHGQMYEEDRSSGDSDDEGRPQGGPAAFNPLAEWGEPMGLPSPAPPEEKVDAAKKGVPKTKPTGPKKPGANNDIKKPEPKKPATKRPASAPKAQASNGVPEKTKSRPSLGAANTTLNTSRVSAAGALNASRLSTTGKAAAKPRPATAPTTRDTLENKPLKNGTKRPSTASGTRSSPAVSKLPPLPAFTPFYVDLTYIPNHGNPAYCDVEFFKRVRARYYVLSALVPNTDTLDALLEGKKTWEDKSVVTTIIPTYDHERLRTWMALNSEKLTDNKIEVAPSASRCSIQLQDHETSSLAFRLEF